MPRNLVALARTKEVIQEIMREPAIMLDIIPSNVLAHKILENAQAVIASLAEKSYFKIGQTVNPLHRWSNVEYGYQYSAHPCWSAMRIVGILEHGEAAGFLEAALISQWRTHSRCLNVAQGGEGVSKTEGPFCVYVVVSASGNCLPRS